MSVIAVSLFVLSILLLAIVVVVALVYLLRGGRGRNCVACGYPLRREWKRCPMCGTLSADSAGSTHSAQSGDLTHSADLARTAKPGNGPVLGDQKRSRSRLKGVLGLTAVICVPVILCVIMGLVMMPGINSYPTGGYFAAGLTREDLGKQEDAFLETFEASDDGGFARSEYGDVRSFKICMWVKTEKGEERKERVDYFLLYINRDDLEFVRTDDGVGTYGFVLQSAQEEQKAAEDREKAARSGSQEGFIIIGEQDYVGRNGRTVTIDGVTYDVEVRDAEELPFDLKALVLADFD